MGAPWTIDRTTGNDRWFADSCENRWRTLFEPYLDERPSRSPFDMADVGGIQGVNGVQATTPSGPLTVATALAGLRRHIYTSVEISDTTDSIAKNLDALQGFAAKVTGISTSDTEKSLAITGAQYQKDKTVLDLWAAGSGQTVTLSAAKASIVGSLASYVTSVAVADTRVAIQSNLDALQSAATSGVLSEIVQTGTGGYLTITAAQLVDDQAALGKIKNNAYSLAITNASVSDVLGLGSDPSLASNSKVKSIAIVDATDAIADHLDDLQRVGLRIKSISQTDATEHIQITGEQYKRDAVVLGKFITSDMLDVIDASASQVKSLAANHKVVTVEIQDTAKNIARNWTLLQNITDSLTSVQVTDQANAISITADQFAGSTTLLGKFSDVAGQTYKLAVTRVGTADAATVAAGHNVESISVLDKGANLVASLAGLQDLNDAGKLGSVTLADPRQAIAMDVDLLKGDEASATQAILDKIAGANYRLAVTGAAASDVAGLAANKRITSFTVNDSSANVTSSLDSLYALGSRLTKIEQTDSGASFSLTQTQLDSRASVLSKISGGYTADITSATGARALADAKNIHVGTVTVSDTGRNIASNWAALRSLGTTLTSITKSDAGALTLSADDYLSGVHDGLVAKFGGAATFAVTGATIAQAQTAAADAVVTKIDLSDESAAIEDNLTALETLADTGKLHAITNQTPTTALNLTAASLTAAAQGVLDLIKGGSYGLSVTGVDAAAAKSLVAANHKIVNLQVTGDAASISANLSDLTGLGKRLTTITQTDAPSALLTLTGTAFEQNAATLEKIQGGFLAVLSQVSAAKAATFAASNQVSSLSVSDTGAHISGAWASLAQLGSKLTGVTESDSSNLQMTMADWTNGQALKDKFTTSPTFSISAVQTSQVAALAADSAVNAIQVEDTAAALSAALTSLATEAKVNQLVVSDPTVALEMSAQTYADQAATLGKVKNGDYAVSLTQVAAATAGTLAADHHVSSMVISDTAAEIGSNFNAIAATDKVDSMTLTNPGGTITLTAAQILANATTLNKIESSFQLSATAATMANLEDLGNVAEVTSIGINDSADNVSTGLGDVIALGGSLADITLTDATPVLAMSEADWTTGASALAKITNSYQVDVSDTAAGDAATIAANATVRKVVVADAAANIVGNWDALVALYNDGAGKLTGLSLTDGDPLALTAEQQTTGASMIAGLLPDETILPA